MLKALALASIRRGFCAPNPAVGAIVVRDGKIIGEGFHFAPGHPHAEVVALHGLDGKLADATLYVTLEPCCHYGRTPPCVERIIAAGVQKVYYGFADPNPAVAGKGAQQLRDAEIECQHMMLPEINDFYAPYQYWTLKKRPFVTAKIALSADGMIAGPEGKPVTITGPECKAFTHQCRMRSDAILTTATTVIHDNPQMNVRQGEQCIKKTVYMLDSSLRMPPDAKLFSTAKKLVIFYTDSADTERLKCLQQQAKNKKQNLLCRYVPASSSGVNLASVLDSIAEDGVQDLWIEAGAKCFLSFYKANLLQRVYIYIAPKNLGSLAYPGFKKEIDFFTAGKEAQWRQLGNDRVCEILLNV